MMPPRNRKPLPPPPAGPGTGLAVQFRLVDESPTGKGAEHSFEFGGERETIRLTDEVLIHTSDVSRA